MRVERSGADQRRATKLSEVRKRIKQRAEERVKKGGRDRP